MSIRKDNRRMDNLCDDYENKCGNCHATLPKGAKYCRMCGTKKGEGAFLPYENVMHTLYGPPIVARYKCAVCGKEWESTGVGGTGKEYCSECGAENKPVSEKSLYDEIDEQIKKKGQRGRLFNKKDED